jgi:polysaccharide export outer membrane protein
MHAWRDGIARSMVLGLLLVGAAACGRSAGNFVWIDNFPVPRDTGVYTLGPGDKLSVQVFGDAKLSSAATVRDDGRISVPLLDDVVAEGKTPEQLARGLEAQLKAQKLVIDPRVTVLLVEPRKLTVAVMGEVHSRGRYTLDPGAGVAEAIASAGGLTDFAHRDRIFVVRRTPNVVRIRFTYDAIVSARGRAFTFRLQPGDVVVAE